MRANFSRRTVLLGGSATAALLLAGCGTDTEGGASSAATAGASGSAGTDTHSFVDSLGRTVEVPNNPRRIVALHESSAGRGLMSVGATVVGMPTRNGVFSPDLKDLDMKDVKPVGDAFVYDIEKIAALEPDLIVGLAKDKSGGKEVGKMPADDLEQIAPTVYLSQTVTVDQYMAKIGDLLMKQDEVARQKKEWDATLAGVKAKYGSKLAWGKGVSASPGMM